MKITVSQLRRIIREEVERVTEAQKPSKATLWDPKYGGGPVWVHGAGKKPGTLMVGTVSGKEMREVPTSSVKFDKGIDSEKYGIPYKDPYAHLTGAPLKDGGVVNRDSGEILDMDSVPPQYLDHVEVDEMGYTTLPNDKFEELRGELKGLSAGKPKKQWKAPFQIDREKMGR